MNHPYQHIIDQCLLAASSVKGQLGPKRFKEVTDYVATYDEWLLGLEFTIGWLTEDQCSISQDAYNAFENAYRMMGKAQDERLRHLFSIVSPSDESENKALKRMP